MRRPSRRVDESAVGPNRREARPRRHRAVLIAALLAALVLGAGAVYAVVFVHSINSDLRAEDDTRKAVAEQLTEAKPNEPFTILLLGADGKGAAGDSRSDTIILGKVDPQQKRVWLISIPRDTKAEIPGYGTAKINKAYQEGGIPLTIQTVEALTGIPINHYAEIDISGFRSVVDSIGGVWIDVDTEIDDPKAAAANYKKAGQHIEPGYQLLDGNHALVYVRSRDFPDADFTRMRHQQEFFKALAKQALSGANILKLPKTVQITAKYVTTDMTAGQLLSVLMDLKSMQPKSLETATLRGEWRSPYVHPDEEYKAYLLNRMVAGVSFEETATPESVVLPPDVSIDVRNGAGIAGAASEAAELLETAGFDVQEVGNAKRSDYEETLVVYAGNRAAAEAVAAALGAGRIQESDGSWVMDTTVLVVIGRDWSGAVAAAQ